MPHFVSGARRFQREVFPSKRSLFERLSGGQEPEALFITCSDSRIEPGMITQTEPGQLFVVRNAGNLVPPYSAGPNASAAAIEFAVSVLGVHHAVVCGHTGCGAMGAIGNPESLESLPSLRGWLQYALPGDGAALEAGPPGEDAIRSLTERNVVLQLEQLRTHPSVQTAVEANDLELHGWIYDIGTGEICEWREQDRAFAPLSEEPPDVLRDEPDD